MRRRTYLASCTGLAGALAGCAGVLDGSDGGSDDDRGPAETVEAFYDAALDGDAETAASYFHDEAQVPPPSERAVEGVSESTIRLEGTEIVENDGETALVEATISQATTGGEREERTVAFELRQADGEWKIYDQPLAGSDRPVAPQVQWDMRERAEDDVVTAVVFEHNGGDTIDSTTLSAIVDGSTVGSPGTSSDITVATSAVVPFDGDGESVGTGSTVELVWTDPDGGSSQTLASFTLTSNTAGSPAEQLRIEA